MMSEYERLSIALARWLTMAGEIEEIVDDIDRTAQHADITDEEYEDICRLREAARVALEGHDKADDILRRLTLSQVRHRP